MIHFLGIGAQKAGSTWFYEHLRTHPDIRFPAGKEVHFWDDEKTFARGEQWWLSLFQDQPSRVRQGEITPAYAILPPERIRRIHHLAPRLRIFYCLRNPIERSWSHAMMVLANRGKSVEEVSDDALLRLLRWEPSIQRGTYTECLQNWLSVFPHNQLVVVFLDDVISNPRAVLEHICLHIGVSKKPLSKKSHGELTARVFEGPRAPIRPALLGALRTLYEPEIRALSDRFGRNLNHWLEWHGQEP